MGQYPDRQIYIITGSFKPYVTAQCPRIRKKVNYKQICHPEFAVADSREWGLLVQRS